MSASAATHWRDDAPVIGLIGLAHAGSHFFHLILPPLFPWITTDLGLSYVQMGLAMSVFFAVSGLAQVVAGFAVDRLGAERILLAGLILLGLGALCAASAQGFAQILLAAVLLGLGNSVFHPADYAILGHHVAQSRLGRAFSVHTIGGSLGWAAAPPAMAFLAIGFDWRVALIIASIAGFAIALCVLAMRQRLQIVTHSPTGLRRFDLGFLRERAILMCFMFFVLQAFVMMSVQSFMPLALNLLFAIDMASAALMLSLFLLAGSGGTLIGGIIADRQIRQEGAIMLGYGLSALCLLLVVFLPPSEWLLFVLLALAGAFAGFTTPSRDLLIRAVAGPARIGTVFGVVYAGLDLGGTLAPYLTALIFDAGRPEWFFPLTAIVTFLTIFTVWGAKR